MCGCPRADEGFSLSPAALAFTASQAGPAPADQTLLLKANRNLTHRSLIWSATSSRPWVTVTPAAGTLPGGSSIPLTAHVPASAVTEAWTGPTATVGSPFADANTYPGWGAWIGNALLIWSGDPTVPGKYYDPVSDTWYGSMATAGSPSKRWSFTSVWTGTEMIVWGGYNGNPATTAYNTGARYNPTTNTWTPTSTVGAPTPRTGHRAVWTGSRMIVWGGDGLGFTYTNTGGIYDPATDTWTGTTSLVGAPPARGSHAAVWTGTRMLIWGGENPAKFNTGYFYDPATDTWTGTTTAVGALSARSHLEGVWTGTEMILWGGSPGAGSVLNTGARYDPATDTWYPMTTTGAPSGRAAHVSVWTGTQLIVFGGNDASTPLNTGGRYTPPLIELGTSPAQVTVSGTINGSFIQKTVEVTLTVTP